VDRLPQHQSGLLEKGIGLLHGRRRANVWSRAQGGIHGDESAPAVLAENPPAKQGDVNLKPSAADRAALIKIDRDGG